MTIPQRTGSHGGLHEDAHAHHGTINEDAHRHHGAAALGHNAASGTIKSTSGTTFVLATKQGELTVTTSAGTNFHSPRRARKPGEVGEESEVGREKLTFATLKVGQRVAVQGERLNDTMLLATRVHIPKP